MEMEMIPAEPVQNLDSKARQRIADCLDNPLILKELLEHCSDPEHLELSLVNKMWNYEARSVIRKRGKLQARLGCYSGYPCQKELEDFGADLEKMNVVPYSRVYMMISATDHTRRSPLDLSENFLARLQLKQLKVLLDGKMWYCKDCSAVLVLQKLLQDYSGVLEKMTLYIEKA